MNFSCLLFHLFSLKKVYFFFLFSKQIDLRHDAWHSTVKVDIFGGLSCMASLQSKSSIFFVYFQTVLRCLLHVSDALFSISLKNMF